jgi:hypothetical protein
MYQIMGRVIYTKDDDRIILRTLKLNVLKKQEVGRQNIRWQDQVKKDMENRVQKVTVDIGFALLGMTLSNHV